MSTAPYLAVRVEIASLDAEVEWMTPFPRL